jgi:hypothetical protein
MTNAPVIRIALLSLLAGVTMASLLTVALRSHDQPPTHTLTAAQKKAYQEGFQLCYQRVMVGADPHGDTEWNLVLRRFDTCTAQLGVPFKTTWEPQENKWRYEIIYPEQAPHS